MTSVIFDWRKRYESLCGSLTDGSAIIGHFRASPSWQRAMWPVVYYHIWKSRSKRRLDAPWTLSVWYFSIFPWLLGPNAQTEGWTDIIYLGHCSDRSVSTCLPGKRMCLPPKWSVRALIHVCVLRPRDGRSQHCLVGDCVDRPWVVGSWYIICYSADTYCW